MFSKRRGERERRKRVDKQTVLESTEVGGRWQDDG